MNEFYARTRSAPKTGKAAATDEHLDRALATFETVGRSEGLLAA